MPRCLIRAAARASRQAASGSRAVVGHDPLDGDAVGGEERRGRGARNAGGGLALLVGVDLGVGQAGVVVDGGVHVVVAASRRGPLRPGGRLAAAVAAVDPPAAAVGEPAELLDVDVDQFAGAVAFVAADRLPVGRSSQASRCRPWRVRTACTVEAGRPTSGPSRAGPSLRWRSARPGLLDLGRVLAGQPVGGAGPVEQPGVASGAPAGQPLVAGRAGTPSSSTTCATGAPGQDTLMSSRVRARSGGHYGGP